MKERIDIPVIAHGKEKETLRLYFNHLPDRKKSDFTFSDNPIRFNDEILEIEINPKFKIHFNCEKDIYIYRDIKSGHLKIGGLEGINSVTYDGDDIEVI